MRAVVQRVSQANVSVEGSAVGEIEKGIMVLVGVQEGDSQEDVKWLVDKVVNLRIFEDENEKMNLSLKDINGKLLAVSQFTLLGDARKGRRPSFTQAGKPEEAKKLFNHFVDFASKHVEVQQGIFQAHMMVSLVNDGPVTILLDSKKVF